MLDILEEDNLKAIKDQVKCIHRHTIDSHPACFGEGTVVDKRPVAEQLARPWFSEPGLKVGYLDIESDGLKVDFSTMLSWAIKEKGGNTTIDAVTKEELFDERGDKRIIQSCIDEMRKYAVIVTYYGTGFDIPFLRAKAMHYNFTNFPHYVFDGKKMVPELMHFDLYYTCKSKLAALSSKRLENVCDYLGIVGKTPLSKDMWRLAKYGNTEALAGVIEHNVGDVQILEQVHDRLTAFGVWAKKGI